MSEPTPPNKDSKPGEPSKPSRAINAAQNGEATGLTEPEMRELVRRSAALERGLRAVQHRIEVAARAAGRDPESIELLPVTKFHPVVDVELLAGLGVTCVGENREQEARSKAEHCAAAKIPMAFDMIGQIQSKKTNHIAQWAHRVHAVDSSRIIAGLDRGVALALDRGNRIGAAEIPVFLQWSADGDPQRGGVGKELLDALADEVVRSAHLQFAGLMVVPPIGADAKQVFEQAAELTAKLHETHGGLGKLSAGMSADMEEAIRAGSTIVRVGTAIMGPRPVTL